MAEMPNVITDEIITSDWGNKIRDRTVQRYDDAATRASENPSPVGGDLAYMQDTGDLLIFHGATWKALLPTGVVVPYAAGTPPVGWLLCQGQEVSRTTYPALFAAIGTTFGAGDGTTTFNLPQLRQRFPIGVALSGTADTLGETGGSIDHTHTGPSHTHTGPSHTHDGPSHTHSTPSHLHDLGNSATDGGGGATSLAGSHSHSFSDTSSSNAGGSGAAAGSFTEGGSHSHSVSGTTGTATSHSHTIPDHLHDLGNSFTGGGGTWGAAGTGDTSSAGTGATGAAGTGATGAANPPFIALHYIIKA
jgi:microcystin-dependent protein